MPAKKIQKYVPQTKYPRHRGEYNYLMKVGATPADVIGWLKERHAHVRQKEGPEAYLQYGPYVVRWDNGELNNENFTAHVADWRYKRMCEYVFRFTPHFRELNERFLAEYDSREDLQEIYKTCAGGDHRWTYTLDEQCITLSQPEGLPYRQRPESYRMFDHIIDYGGRSMIETARETPYVEGDLVLLRDTAVDTDADPLRVARWSQQHRQGMTTPDKSVKRIGTVMSVTGNLSQSWRPVKGSKVLKIMWMGIEDAKIVDVEERWVKWYERPTYKNGLKTRPE